MMSRVTKGLVRLDRALSKLGLASRSEAKRLIADGRVRVAGRVIRDGAVLTNQERGDITVDGGRRSLRHGGRSRSTSREAS
jgi:23S rRNA pseudouridine2605 synthase